MNTKAEGAFFEHSFVVGSSQNGSRLDRILTDGWPQISRTVWRRRIEAQEVLLNGSPARPAKRVSAGDTVLFRFQKRKEPDVNTNYSFLYGLEPKDCVLAVFKPPDLPVHPSGIYFRNTLTELLKKNKQLDFPVFLLNRLDRETSGIVLLTRDKATAAKMQRILQTEAKKEYLVFVEGSFPVYLDAKGLLGRRADSTVKKQMHFVREGDAHSLQDAKSCRTEFWKIGEKAFLDGSVVSFVRAVLHTGRMHQIRATLHSLGFPVVGDRLYGTDPAMYLRMIEDKETPSDRKRLRIHRSALHAWRISFPHPKTAQPMSLVCPLPDDLKGLLPKNTNENDILPSDI